MADLANRPVFPSCRFERILGCMDESKEPKKFPAPATHSNDVGMRGGGHSVISPDRLLKLKQLFAEDGISLTDAEALEIGLWLLARVKPILRPIPLDKMGLFATMRSEFAAIRQKRDFVNLYQWRRRKNVSK